MATVDETMMKVQRLLTGPMGLEIGLKGDLFTVRFTDASTAVHVRVRDWGKDSEGQPRSLVLVSAPILREVPPSPALFEWVARNGGTRWFGHVEVYDDREPGKVSLFFSHTLLGDYLDEKELAAALWGVLQGADEWDDQLKAQFGGKRWIDA
jgi:hypothetical protein